MSLEIERSDYVRTPGRNALLQIGPFAFSLDTADGLSFAFVVTVGSWTFGWGVEPA